LAAATIATSLLAGCTAPDESDAKVTVSGSFGAPPELTYSKPLVVTEPQIEVVWEGDGPVADEGSTVLLNLFGQDGGDGTQIVNTFEELPRVHRVTLDSLGGRLHTALLGQEAG